LTHNEVSGTVAGPSIQARSIHGGVHFHGSVTPIVPRQVPAPTAHFTGRRQELEMLRQATPVVVLSGAGGTGKTALACQWAQEASDRFPDGQLFVPLNGFGTGSPRHPVEALRSCLAAFGGPVEESSLEQLTARYRSCTAGRRLLVVLDDAYSAAQARVLLPASTTSMAVVTSRGRLSGLIADGATLIDLGALSVFDSVELLAGVVGRSRVTREQEQAARLAELCGGLPLALSVAGARLVSRPRLTIAGVVARLADEAVRLEGLDTPDEELSVRGSIALSYRGLDEATAALYRRLARHPGPEFGLGPVGSLTPHAVRLIDVLLEANLLQEVAEERYGFHDLVRLHALGEDEGPEALHAMTEWYLAAASRADLVVTPHRRRLEYRYRATPFGLPAFDDRDQALTWLERERGNLNAAGQAALDRGWAELAWQMSDVLWPLQLYRKSVDRRDIDARGLAAARLWGNPRAEARMLKRLGRTSSTLGEHESAERLLVEAVARSAEVGDVEGGIEAEEMLALAYRDAGRIDAAMPLLGQVLTARRGLGRSRDIALTLINLGDLSLRRGRSAEAVAFFHEAGELLAESVRTDPYNPVRVRIGLARAYLAAADLARADRLAAESVEGMRRLGAEVAEAEALELAASIAARRGDRERCRQNLRRALKICEAHGSPRSVTLRRQLAEAGGDIAERVDDQHQA
jgi:tetratricopeptide (TPR) repeat protein